MRYLSQRYTMPFREVVGILNDIGTEELAHLEMVSSIVYQLLRNATTKEIEEGGFADYFVDHTTGVWPQSAGGVPAVAGAAAIIFILLIHRVINLLPDSVIKRIALGLP